MGKKIAVIGGGITGLSAAYYLQKMAEDKKLPLDLALYEASDRLGGKIETEHREGFVIEKGPDSFLKRKPAALELVSDLGLSDSLVSNHTGKSYILKGGRLHIIPEGSVMGVPGQLKPFLDSGLLSDDGKARALDDLFLPALPPYEDMSVGDFFEKRLGHEMVESIITPLLSGVYGGNIYRLSLSATLPQFKDIEKKSRSLILGVNGKAPKKKSSQFATLRTGLGTLVDSLAARLGGLTKTGAGIVRIEKTPDRYQLDLSNGERVMADGVVLAIPHDGVERLFPDAGYLRRPQADPDTSVATVAMAFDRKDVKLSLEGTGFVVSRKEPASITAATWTHLKWPHTAPEGKALLRAFVGKPGDEAIVDESDGALIEASLRDLRNIDGIRIEKDPEFSIVTRLKHSMPQYAVGHLKWLQTLNENMSRQYPNVYPVGISYDGVGLPDCIRQGKSAAEKLVAGLFLQAAVK